MSRPFLSVITRHLRGRSGLLARCQQSLIDQTRPDYEQIVIVDDVGSGFAHARQMLIDAAAQVRGEYVLILDDDDYMVAKNGIEALKGVAGQRSPVVIFRGNHAELGVLPARNWQQRPIQGDIGSFDFILRADVYRQAVMAEIAHDYAHDYAIIEAAYDIHEPQVVWLDKVICAADKRRIGAISC